MRKQFPGWAMLLLILPLLLYIPVMAGEVTEPAQESPDSMIEAQGVESAGEGDVTVLALMAVTVLGALAALGAVGTCCEAIKRAKEAGDTKNKHYKMMVRKSFADTLFYDKPGVPIYVRMVEISTDGFEKDRFDLTHRIRIFPGSAVIKVTNPGVSANYVGAYIAAESTSEGDNPTEGVVCFRYSGEGGTFQNNVTFKLTHIEKEENDHESKD